MGLEVPRNLILVFEKENTVTMIKLMWMYYEIE